MAATKPDVYERITDTIIAQLEEGVIPWQKPWRTAGLPKSMSTGRTYRGINLFVLAFADYASPWWGTYNQITELGGQVRKRERGTLVMLYTSLKCKAHKADPCKECGNGRFARGFVVFNAEQADGLPEKFGPVTARAEHDPIAECEAIVTGYVGTATGPKLSATHGAASYNRMTDKITMPRPEQFFTSAEYYSTLFHEMTHSTGHVSRLGRDDLLDSHRFGDASYSREELTAEMGAAFLCALTGIDNVTVGNSAAYLDNWLTALKADKTMLTKAAVQAQQAIDVITGTAAEQEVAA